jgi:hypothetical protein
MKLIPDSLGVVRSRAGVAAGTARAADATPGRSAAPGSRGSAARLAGTEGGRVADPGSAGAADRLEVVRLAEERVATPSGGESLAGGRDPFLGLGGSERIRAAFGGVAFGEPLRRAGRGRTVWAVRGGVKVRIHQVLRAVVAFFSESGGRRSFLSA